ncbi:PTS sugar transporter subunit IIC [Allofustis seminis]|uniref:PTS sugar transporter subunit IIC n=1 Tax=Allofustis seminis TaxID=166939 RepID=UPI0003645078|nr:PTS sugar transporter subunit IIC [Allofustis seminis]
MSNDRNLTSRFMDFATKVGSQRHLVAIRDGFIALMPLTMAGSIAVLLNVFFRDIPNTFEMTGFVETMQPLIEINGYVYFGTIAIMALVFAFSLGHSLSTSYGVNGLSGGLVSVASFIATVPQMFNVNVDLTAADAGVIEALKGLGLTIESAEGATHLVASDWGGLSVNFLGATGLFTALIIGLLSTQIFVWVTKRDLIIKLPDSVPPAVNKAFAAIVPGTLAIYTVGLITMIVTKLSGQGINDLISFYIQQPLLGLSQGWFSVVLLSFLVQLFWFFGLHGHNVLAPIMDGIYMPALIANTEAYEATKSTANLPYLWTRGSFDAYAQLGGSGMTLALLIAIFVFSKREDYRTIARLSLPMGIFNINEPVTFGIPMVLNPVYIIPWLFVAPICAGIAYFATAIGFAPPVFLSIPWITPPVLYAFLATGGSITAALVAAVNFVVAFLIWAVFVRSANKIKIEE